MSNELIDILDRAVSSVVQEFHKDASVVVQFAAGDWHAIKEALSLAKGESPAPIVGSDAPQGADSSPADAAPVQASEPASFVRVEPIDPVIPETFLPPGI